ncbi:hypothetical protein PSTT_05602 [Puccinia striiformis]|uniref:DUF6589 domain-containing protein n=1 Tax=Puccinia striiformis TaxID=27350 RepID=A0A2S4VN54_9BASI|nr:hypothetical protein PSTT_05602 [Puccinia striiformis]
MANIHPVVDAKVLAVCEALNKLPTKITPKVFFMRFLVSTYSQLPYLRGCWATKKGINSTMDLASALRDEINKTALGREAWEAFILQEAIQIASKQEPPRGNFPKGAFHSSTTVANHFFTAEEQQVHDNLTNRNPTDDSAQEEERPPVDPTETPDDSSTSPEEMDGIAYELAHNPQDRYNHRAKRIVTTICSMVGFARNRRANALQLHNSVRFFACGISERVQEYMNYLGLCSSRSTGMSALNTLAKGNIKMLKTVMAINKEIPMAASICIDNIDMEQRVHQSSVGHRSHTFRGTWGYIHLPNKKLLATLDCSQLTLDAYHEAIKQVPSMEIEPMMFLPTKAEQEVELAVWKSQIASVLHKYLATPLDKKTALPTEPPQVEQISHEAPDLHMLKLMDASDNSAEGMGQVFHNLLQQTGLTSEEFFSQLQPMDGDLGTVQNFNCLQAQRAPSAVPSNRLDNIFFQLGAAHTLWNIASNIFSHHFGDSSDSSNCGAWQHLEALGFPSDKAIQKKDFTLMVNQMERVFEAMSNANNVPEERVQLPTAQWNAIVEECYETYFTPKARSNAASKDSPKLSNTLLQLHDFSTVVEAKRAMKAGDIGRVMIVWKKWCLMAQALSGITNYSSYLPRMVLLLTKILPPSLAKYMRHNLLFSPTGRSNHFVAKDYWLEIQNYWIKFLYTKYGPGLQIERLKELFSVNIFLVIAGHVPLSEARLWGQDHSPVSQEYTPGSVIAMFTLMANNRDILAQYAKPNKKEVVAEVGNIYKLGIKK